MENKCTLCQVNPATKTNSHIIPSFLVAMVASYDGSYARGKEIMFTIDPYKTRVYTGSIPSTEYERIFNYPELTEERIEQELSQNSVADDYIFCPTCEKDFATYLEGPYAEFSKMGKKIDASIPLLFWISVIWRMSVAGTFGFKLKSHQEEYLQYCINQYFKLKKEKQDVSSYLSKIGLGYKLLYCKDYSKNNGSMIFARYDEQTDSLSLFIGDYCICMLFDARADMSSYSFFTLEAQFVDCVINNGILQECHMNISSAEMDLAMSSFIEKVKKLKIYGEFKVLDKLWEISGRWGIMPLRMKFCFLNLLYDDNVKIGERHTAKRYLEIFKYLVENIIVWY